MDTPALFSVIDYLKDYEPETIARVILELKNRSENISKKRENMLTKYASDLGFSSLNDFVKSFSSEVNMSSLPNSKEGLNLLTIEVWKFSAALIFLIYIGITVYSFQEGLLKTKMEVLWTIGVLLYMAINFYVAYAVVDNFKRIEKVIEKHHRN